MTADLHFHIAAMLADAHLQEHAKQIVGQMETMVADSKLQALLSGLAQQIEAPTKDFDFAQHAKLVVEEIHNMMTDHNIQEQAKRTAEQLQAIYASPIVEGSMAVIAEKIRAVDADTKLQQQAELVSKQLQMMLADPHVHAQAELVADRFKSMISDNSGDQADAIVNLMEKFMADLHEQAMDIAGHEPRPRAGNTIDHLFSRALKMPQVQRRDLDATTLGKSGRSRAAPDLADTMLAMPAAAKTSPLRNWGLRPRVQPRMRRMSEQTLAESASSQPSPEAATAFAVFEKKLDADGEKKFDRLGRLTLPLPPGCFSTVGRMLEIHKALWLPAGLLAMYVTGNYGLRACLMTGLFGAYGIIWVLKSYVYPDLNFYNGEDSKLTSPVAYAGVFASVGIYFIYPVLAAMNKVDISPVTAITSLVLFVVGGFLHWAGDAQRYFELKYNPGKLITDGFYAYIRHPNYTGEMMMWTAMSMVAGALNPLSWIPMAWLILAAVIVGAPKKEKSLSRYPEFEEWKKKTPMFVPGLR
eukprot:gnl/TRDRNA2_/TRDRNA2_161137_c0_seq1.p1 gnl/TRDRNA2_/TRDRNA2_161137_c0~~gnl/TRDRNA2_/TRDRNA2_161137_c0_seq1.p1  ORF type:complete len:541 (-),score=95.00 gnl/TRDRNA2_/TRDRNA2_161137_c0_seq1:101-1678(-)